MSPSPLSRDGIGAVWIALGVDGYWRPWFIKQNTVFYLPTCFDTHNEAVQAATLAHGMASN
jgi:hypothetical protein